MAQSRNPYVVGKGATPQLRHSVLLFMDILGYRQLSAEAFRVGKQQEFLNKLHSALREGRHWFDNKELRKIRSIAPKDHFALRAFTDNIILAWPIRDDAEIELGDALSRAAEFQFNLSMHGFFARGAIAVGDAFVDDIAVYGSALTDAYQGETELARDPRVILMPSAVQAANEHLSYYGRQSHAPQAREILCDSDGQWFVNYLEEVLFAMPDAGPFYREFERHRLAVEEKLRAYKSEPPILQKYIWVANYHNWFCDFHSDHFSDEHKVNSDLLRSTPRLITDS